MLEYPNYGLHWPWLVRRSKLRCNFFLQKVKEAMQHIYSEFEWDVYDVMSDGARDIGSWAKKLWPELLAWLQCLLHVIRILTAKLRGAI